jgi:hypothetical protein
MGTRGSLVAAAVSCALAASAAFAQTELTPGASGVTASTNDGNLPGNVVDNNLGTRWSGNGDGAWIQLDLGAILSVGSVRVAVHNGNSRQNHFDLQVSSGGATWDTVWSGSSSGTTTLEETYDFADVDARWVRYLGHGSTATTFNSVSEISVFAGSGIPPTPTPTSPVPVPTATPTATPPATSVEITPGGSAVTASTNDGNLPANTVDGSLGTRWSANGDGQWIKYDLGSVSTVTHASLAFYSGDQRQSRFDLQVSTDNSTWTNVLTGALSSGTQTTEQTFDFTDQPARWVRYMGHGNTVNLWNSVTEVSLFGIGGTGPTPTPAPTATPGPGPTATPTATPGSPTGGWTQTSFTYAVHKPYNLSVSARFSYSGGVWTTWVYNTDAAHTSTSGTMPRSELRWNNNYTSGNHMWDGDLYLVNGTNGTSIQQVFGAEGRATASMVFAYSASGGSIRRYDSTSEILATGIYETWINMKSAHDANGNIIRIYINDSLKRTDADHGNNTHYFKNGVYGQNGASFRMECRFRNLRYWRR